MIGARKGGYRRSPAGGNMNKKNPSGGGGRNINICEVKKNVITIIGVPAKKIQGGMTKNTPTTYGKNGLYVERKDCPHRKIPT